MSVKAMAWAWQTKLKGNRKFVLLALADHSDDEGKCWPGLKGLAEKCGIDRGSIIAHIQELEKLGFISKEKRHDQKGYRKSNLYMLNFQSPEIQHRKNQRWDFPSQSRDLPPESSIEPSSNNKYINNNKSINRKKYEELMKRIDNGDIFAGVITE